MTDDAIPGVDDYTHLLDSSHRAACPDKAARAKPEMNDFGKELCARFKEIFHAYTNRMERNAQTTLGPSEIGTPCERRLAMQLMGCTPVNPGMDNWASFIGTCIHAGLGDMFTWADANTGRYASEMPLTFPSKLVPKGTGDLLDRTLLAFIDFKAQGTFSLNKLKTEGPPQTYRVQLHTYGMGAEDRGEQIERVAILSLPRQNSTLQSMWCWNEPYDRQVALDAIARVEGIQHQVNKVSPGWTPVQVAASFPVADDCTWCPYHKPNAKSLEHGGCNGRA